MDIPQTDVQPPKTKRVLATSFMVDVFNLVLSGVVAGVTGSVVMLVAAFQSFAEFSSAGVLLGGRKYANRRPTKLHPFGFGKELYYWSTLGAFIIIAVVGVLALRFGYQEILHPTSVNYLVIALLALVGALGANLYSFRMSARKVLGEQPFSELPKVFMSSPLLAAKATMVLDVMGSLASLAGLLMLSLVGLGGSTRPDGIGAVIMGLIYFAGGVALLFSVRTLITGQSATPEVERKIRDAAREVSEVKHVLGMRTLMLSSDKLLVNIEVHLRDGLNTDQVEAAVEKVKKAIEDAVEGLQVHVEPDAYTDVHDPRQ